MIWAEQIFHFHLDTRCRVAESFWIMSPYVDDGTNTAPKEMTLPSRIPSWNLWKMVSWKIARTQRKFVCALVVRLGKTWKISTDDHQISVKVPSLVLEKQSWILYRTQQWIVGWYLLMEFCWFRIPELAFVALKVATTFIDGLCVSQVSRKSVYCIDAYIPSFGTALIDENHSMHIWRWPAPLMHWMHWTRLSIASVFDVTDCHGIEHFEMWVRGTWNC